MAPGWSANQLRGVLGEDVLAELMAGADWPVMARQLVGLQQAGVDLGVFPPLMGRTTATGHQAVAANTTHMWAEGTGRWAGLLKSTMPEGLVRDAILASPARPDIAAATGHLDARRHHHGCGRDHGVRARPSHPGGDPRSRPRSRSAAGRRPAAVRHGESGV
ncbi:hypothetical protein [Streptomyces sp. NPDC058613]|uniref:hypothetical protein n=1 Tax=unclassified Streptomyces TaxID=2593676 RepID=UPI003646EC1A